MVREKMPRSERAKQFAPFDALKGLQNALSLKEYEHEKIVKNEMSEDQIMSISNVLLQISKGDLVKIAFFQDGHLFDLEGTAVIDYMNKNIKVGNFLVDFDDIRSIEMKTKE